MNKVPMPHPRVMRSFVEQLHLEHVDAWTFRSTRGGLPSDGRGFVDAQAEERLATYGGHVFAQAVWAASKAFPHSNFVVHSVTGYWLRPAWPDEAFQYHVSLLKDGRHLRVCRVDVCQPASTSPDQLCFTCVCSFKNQSKDPHAVDLQAVPDTLSRYEPLLQGKAPSQLPSTTNVNNGKEFMDWKGPPMITPSVPGLKSSLISMHDLNKERLPLDCRTLFYYTAIGPMPPSVHHPNLDACVHLYASDRESLFVVLRHAGLGKHCRQLKSLSQTVIFHTGAQNLATSDANDRERWFSQEVWTDRIGDSRCVHHSQIHDENGIHVATTIQDGLMRLSFDCDQDRAEAQERLWGPAKL